MVEQSQYFLAFLHASRALLARLYLRKAAKTTEVVKDGHEELVAFVRRSISRPWIFVSFQTVVSMKRSITCDCSCALRRTRGSGRSSDKSNHGNSLHVLIFSRSAFETNHLVGSSKASRDISIWSSGETQKIMLLSRTHGQKRRQRTKVSHARKNCC